MKSHFASAGILSVLLAASVQAVAQQAPITGQMMEGGKTAAASAPAASAPAVPQTSAAVTRPLDSSAAAMPPSGQLPPAPPATGADVAPMAAAPAAVWQPPPHVTVVGETTRSLLQRQVDGNEAGKPLPMLGAEASASYNRYLRSFNHDIPEFFKTNVGKDSNGTGNGTGGN